VGGVGWDGMGWVIESYTVQVTHMLANIVSHELLPRLFHIKTGIVYLFVDTYV